jgi:hypothetical protein
LRILSIDLLYNKNIFSELIDPEIISSILSAIESLLGITISLSSPNSNDPEKDPEKDEDSEEDSEKNPNKEEPKKNSEDEKDKNKPENNDNESENKPKNKGKGKVLDHNDEDIDKISVGGGNNDNNDDDDNKKRIQEELDAEMARNLQEQFYQEEFGISRFNDSQLRDNVNEQDSYGRRPDLKFNETYRENVIAPSDSSFIYKEQERHNTPESIKEEESSKRKKEDEGESSKRNKKS